MIPKVTMLLWVGLRKLVMIMCWNAARPFMRKQCHGSPELSSSALNQSNLWTRATTHGKIWPPRSTNTPHDFACGPLVSLFWLLRLPTGSTLFYILIIFSFVFSILPQFNNKPIIDNKYLNSWQDSRTMDTLWSETWAHRQAHLTPLTSFLTHDTLFSQSITGTVKVCR